MNTDISKEEDLKRLEDWANSIPYDKKIKGSSANIYFITDGEYVKIGVSTNLIKRLNSLQTGNPRELKVLYSFETDWPYIIETILHKKYRDKHIRYEWYDILDEFPLYRLEYLTPKDIESILKIDHNATKKLINSDDFPAIRIGRSMRVSIINLNEYLYTHIVNHKGRRLVLDNKPISLVNL